MLTVCVCALLVSATGYAIGKREPRRQLGYGQVRFNGLGPERWAQRYRREHRLRLRLEQRLHARSLQILRASRGFRRDVGYAIRLAAAAYGVPQSELWAVASCETGGTFSPYARNGRYRGLFQEGPMFERGVFGRAGFSPFDSVANALTAARTVAREGWRQWSCRP